MTDVRGEDAKRSKRARADEGEPFIQQDRGKLEIADNVIASIASKEAFSVPGVADLGGSLMDDIRGLLSGGTVPPGVKIKRDGRSLTLSLSISARYGVNIPALVRGLKDRVSLAVEAITGLKVKEITITVDRLVVDPPKT